MSWAMTDAVLLAGCHSHSMWISPVRCREQSQNNTATVWGSREQDFSKLSDLEELLALHTGFSPKRWCNNEDNCWFGITEENVDKKCQWAQTCYKYNKLSAWMNARTNSRKECNNPVFAKKSWFYCIRTIMIEGSRICVQSLQCLCTCANWYYGTLSVTIRSYPYLQ